LSVPISSTVCSGRTEDICNIECNEGTVIEGVMRCEGDGIFRGAECRSIDSCHSSQNDCTEDSVCESLENGEHTCHCTPGFFSIVAAGIRQECRAHTKCHKGRTFQNGLESSVPTAHHDRVCSPVSGCDAGQYLLRAPTETADTVCGVCSQGTYQPLEVSLDPFAGHLVTECAACHAGSVDGDGDPTTDCTPCSAGQFSAAGATICTNCHAGLYDDDRWGPARGG
jgi:hypothetical protein